MEYFGILRARKRTASVDNEGGNTTIDFSVVLLHLISDCLKQTFVLEGPFNLLSI